MSTATPTLGKRARDGDDGEVTKDLESDSKKHKVDETKTYETKTHEGLWHGVTYSLKDEPDSLKDASATDVPLSLQRLVTLTCSGDLKSRGGLFSETWSFHYAADTAFDWQPYFKHKSLSSSWFRDMCHVEQLKEVQINGFHADYDDDDSHVEAVEKITIELADHIDIFGIKILTKHRLTGENTMFHSMQMCSPTGRVYLPECHVPHDFNGGLQKGDVNYLGVILLKNYKSWGKEQAQEKNVEECVPLQQPKSEAELCA